jgi:hypothetical protein
VIRPLSADVMTPQSVASKERHGYRLLPKSWFCGSSHRCDARCVGCRKTFRVCPEDRCFVERPRKMFCAGCSQVANERWLKGWPNKLATCPNCWEFAYCSKMTLDGDSVRCRCCEYRWSQSGEPWHKDAEAMGFRDP